MDGGSVRERHIDSGNRALNGDFDLLDSLSIWSTAGKVRANIRPQPVNEKGPLPAQLWIDSRSGSVNVDFPAFNAPPRDYRVSIGSTSGAIEGNIIHGRATSVNSEAGRIEMKITPFAVDDCASNLNTSTRSGAQRISVLAPANGAGVGIKLMSSLHSAHSGSLKLRYPKEWEGTINGHTMGGKVEIHGRDVEIIRQGTFDSSGRYILAKKGNGNSTLDFHTDSGSVEIHFD